MEGYDATTYGELWADIYDEEWSGVIPVGDTVTFLQELAGKGPALELAIGTGRIAIPLKEAGVEVHGVTVGLLGDGQLTAFPLDRFRCHFPNPSDHRTRAGVIGRTSVQPDVDEGRDHVGTTGIGHDSSDSSSRIVHFGRRDSGGEHHLRRRELVRGGLDEVGHERCRRREAIERPLAVGRDRFDAASVELLESRFKSDRLWKKKTGVDRENWKVQSSFPGEIDHDRDGHDPRRDEDRQTGAIGEQCEDDKRPAGRQRTPGPLRGFAELCREQSTSHAPPPPPSVDRTRSPTSLPGGIDLACAASPSSSRSNPFANESAGRPTAATGVAKCTESAFSWFAESEIGNLPGRGLVDAAGEFRGAIGVLEITRQATLLQTQILNALEIYTFLGLQYFVLLTLLTWLSRYLERKFPQYS